MRLSLNFASNVAFFLGLFWSFCFSFGLSSGTRCLANVFERTNFLSASEALRIASKDNTSIRGKDDGTTVEVDRSEDLSSGSVGTEASSLEKSLKGLTPTQSYLIIHDFMVRAQSFKQIKPILSEGVLKKAAAGFIKTKMDSENRVAPEVMEEQIFKLMKLMMYRKVRVTSEKIDGNEAVLTAVPLSSSPLEDGMDDMEDEDVSASSKESRGNGSGEESASKLEPVVTGMIILRLENGVWKHHKELWHKDIGDTGSGDSVKVISEASASDWCNAASNEKFNNKPVSGKLKGAVFTMHDCEYENFVNSLTFKSSSDEFSANPKVTIFLFNEKVVPYDQTFVSSGENKTMPRVHVRYKTVRGIETKVYTSSDHYGLRLQFNKKSGKGKLCGSIVLRLPDSDKSEINGNFCATVK